MLQAFHCLLYEKYCNIVKNMYENDAETVKNILNTTYTYIEM